MKTLIALAVALAATFAPGVAEASNPSIRITYIVTDTQPDVTVTYNQGGDTPKQTVRLSLRRAVEGYKRQMDFTTRQDWTMYLSVTGANPGCDIIVEGRIQVMNHANGKVVCYKS